MSNQAKKENQGANNEEKKFSAKGIITDLKTGAEKILIPQRDDHWGYKVAALTVGSMVTVAVGGALNKQASKLTKAGLKKIGR